MLQVRLRPTESCELAFLQAKPRLPAVYHECALGDPLKFDFDVFEVLDVLLELGDVQNLCVGSAAWWIALELLVEANLVSGCLFPLHSRLQLAKRLQTDLCVGFQLQEARS